MYLQVVKAALVEALRATFDDAYPEPDFRRLRISIEYPINEQDYPGLWVQYEDTDELTVAGIGHMEIVRREDGVEAPVTRWKFGGTVTVTCVAMTSLERDRLFDAVVRTLAFAKFSDELGTFRRLIEQNDLVAMNANFDQMRPSGDAASPGTPWGTDHVIYEKSISIDLIGEFISDPQTAGLVNLRQIVATGYPEGTREPTFVGEDTATIPGYDGNLPDRSFTVRSPNDWF